MLFAAASLRRISRTKAVCADTTELANDEKTIMKHLFEPMVERAARQRGPAVFPMTRITSVVTEQSRPYPVPLRGACRAGLLPILLIPAALVVLAGCSMIPSPLIVGDTYTNFEYEYSVDLPDGWMIAEDSEDALEKHAGWIDGDKASLVLIHPESWAVIAVLNQKQTLTFPRYIDIGAPYWEERIEAMRDRLDAEVDVGRYDYHIYKDNLVATQQHYFLSQRTYKPETVFEVDALFVEDQVPKQLLFEWFLYPCQKDRSCQTIVMMICREERLEEVKPAFDAMVAALRAHDYYN